MNIDIEKESKKKKKKKKKEKMSYSPSKIFLNKKFFTCKFYQKTYIFDVFTKNYIKKLTFLKILHIKLFLMIKKHSY